MKRNKHSLSHNRLLSCDMGALVPIGWFEVLPGDTIQHATSALLRASPMLSPVMHPMDVRIHHWFVPYRLLWSSFEDFITGGPSGTSLPTFPTITFASAPGLGSLSDYLGVPHSVTGQVVSALPYRAYARIWNESYRDEDLQSALVQSTADGNDTTTSTAIQNISWEKDYFTSARPFEQKGPAVSLPLGTSAPVKTNASDLVTGAQTALKLRQAPTGNVFPASKGLGVDSGSNVFAGDNPLVNVTATAYPSNLFADLSSATAATVNQLRQAMAIQRFEEARARYGSRYVEYLRYLGVRSSDARLQRAEYLGGGKNRVQFSEVLQVGPSASPDQANTVGALKGHGISAMRSNRYRRFIEEHGLIMSLLSIRPKTIYMNGLDKKFNRRLKEEFWQRELEHIGQQAVKNKEVYSAAASPDGTFGYQDRYDEYRRIESGVSGEFRTILNYWHLARDFSSEPALNAAFVSSVPTMRTFASTTTDPFYVMAAHSIQARRMVSKKGNSFIF
ncbi:MAG: major capsid protein [Microviridae sp.]|nr:MAG: major capsid protein [Microviridae sp.]